MADTFNRTVTAGAPEGGNIVLGLLAGVVAAILGALIWMGVAVGLNMHLGLVAILIGLMVGFAIRLGGHGGSPLFGIMGAVLTLLGCVAGDLLTIFYVASTPQQGMLDLAKSADYVQLVTMIFTKMDVMGYVIYGIAIYEGYKFLMRK